MTRPLASSGPYRAVADPAVQHVLADVHLSARAWALVILAALALTVLYLLGCRIWPYGPCFVCRVHPRRNPGSNRKRHGRCKVCRGTGERLRVGTRLIRATGYKGGRWPR